MSFLVWIAERARRCLTRSQGDDLVAHSGAIANSAWNRGRLFLAFGLILAGFVSATTGADDDVEGSPSENGRLRLPTREESTGTRTVRPKKAAANGSLWTTVISLAVIVGGLVVAGRWLRTYVGIPRGLPIEALELLGRRAIDQKVTLQYVRCGSRILILGISPEGVRTLSEITDPEEVRKLVDACQQPTESRIALFQRSTNDFVEPPRKPTTRSIPRPHIGDHDSASQAFGEQHHG